MTVLKLSNVTKVYRTETVETRAVDGVDLDLAEGETVAILGRSGSGKSSLAAIAGLLDRPSEGRVWFAGEDVTNASERHLASLRRQHVSFVFQSFHLVPHLTASQNVALALQGHDGAMRSHAGKSADALDRLGLGTRLGHYPSQLSGGQQQRVAIARALVRKPTILICDEPTGNLDTENSRRVVDILNSVRLDGMATLVVTHDEDVGAMADRRLRMTDGRFAAGEQ